MNCSSGCPTPGAHATWGECMRAKNTRVGWAASAAGRDKTRDKNWDRELQEYRDARAQGIQPRGTSTAAIREAVDISQVTGKAYDASDPIGSTLPDGLK